MAEQLHVPLVDLAAPDSPARIDEACRRVGFLAITNHGVPGEVIAAMRSATDEFFALDLDQKLALRSPSVEINRGYAAKGTEGLSYSLGATAAPPDLFEAFNIGPEELPAGDPAYAAERHRFFAPNIWPERPASLRPALLAYFDEMGRLSARLMRLFALALGIDPEFFATCNQHPTVTMRAINYERGPGDPPPLDGQQRMGAHTDYGVVTILYADPVPGLQIVGPDNQWHDVIPEPGTLLCNLGDLLSKWTNDRWRSTLHRVVPPAGHDGGPARRRSVAYFNDADYDAWVECLPTCTSPDDPPRYPPVRAGEHLLAKLLGPRLLQASSATSTAGDRPTA